MPPPLITNDWFNGKKRPAEFGDVIITFEEIAHDRGPIVRPISVSGIVAVGKTTGRPPAPEPISGLRVSEAAAVPARFRYDEVTGNNAYNSGIPDAEKGHIMALELGGPDIPENIVPQWAKWQGSGEWRRIEVAIEKMASAAYSSKTQPCYIQFHAIVGYVNFGRPEWAALKRLAFPSRFTVTVTKLDKKTKQPLNAPTTVYDASPMRNETDDMMAMRTFAQVDGDLGYSDWVTRSRTTKGKKRDASHFADTGQDPRYAPPSVRYSTPPSSITPYDTKVGNALVTNKRARLNLPGDNDITTGN